MIRIGLSIAAAVAIVTVALVSAGTTVYAQEAGTARAEGRRVRRIGVHQERRCIDTVVVGMARFVEDDMT